MSRRSVLAVAFALAIVAAEGAQAATPVYYALPAGVNVSQGIATAPNGDVWFAADGTTQPPTTTIGRLRPSAATVNTSSGVATFPTPVPAAANCCANRVVSVAFDGPRNRVWFVQNDGVVGYGSADAVLPGTSNAMTAVRLPGRQSLYDVAVGQADGAYFTEYSADNSASSYGNRIAFVTGGLAVTEFDNIAQQSPGGGVDSLRYDAKPAGITLDAQGLPWFAEADPGNPGYRIAQGLPQGGPRSAGGYNEYLVQPCGQGAPCSGSYTGTGITDVAVAADGSKWFTNQLKNEIGRFDGTTFTSYSLQTIDQGLAGGQARAITAAPDGSLWAVEYGGFSHPTANAIIRIDPATPAAPTATVYHLGAGRYPFGVAPDANGNVWFTTGTDSAPALIGELQGVLAGGGGAPGDGGTPGGSGSPPPPGPGATPGPARHPGPGHADAVHRGAGAGRSAAGRPRLGAGRPALRGLRRPRHLHGRLHHLGGRVRQRLPGRAGEQGLDRRQGQGDRPRSQDGDDQARDQEAGQDHLERQGPQAAQGPPQAQGLLHRRAGGPQRQARQDPAQGHADAQALSVTPRPPARRRRPAPRRTAARSPPA